MCSSRGGSGSTLPTLPHLGAVPTSEGLGAGHGPLRGASAWGGGLRCKVNTSEAYRHINVQTDPRSMHERDACSTVATDNSACSWLDFAFAFAVSAISMLAPLSPSASPPATWWLQPPPPADGLASPSPPRLAHACPGPRRLRHQPCRLQYGGCSRLCLWLGLTLAASARSCSQLIVYSCLSLSSPPSPSASSPAARWLQPPPPASGLAQPSSPPLLRCSPWSSPPSPSASPFAAWWLQPPPPASGLASPPPLALACPGLHRCRHPPRRLQRGGGRRLHRQVA